MDFFASFSGVLDWIVLILVWFERSLHSAQVSGQSCPWPLKLMTSQRVKRTWIRTGSYRRFGGEWVNNSSWYLDIEMSRTTSCLTSETKLKLKTFISVANILCALPQMFIVAKRTRSDLANLQLIPASLRQIPKTSLTNLRTEFPYLVHDIKLMAIFHNSNYPSSQWRNRLIPQFRVSSDLTSHT